MADQTLSYRISVVNDFFAVPADRLADCLADFADAVAAFRLMAEAVRAQVEAAGIEVRKPVASLPEFTWTDDGVRAIRIQAAAANGERSVIIEGRA